MSAAYVNKLQRKNIKTKVLLNKYLVK